MDLNVTIPGMVLLVIALASIAGGLVLYRGSRRVGWRAVGMSAVALGIGVLLVFAITLPVSTEGEAPEPVVVMDLVPAQLTEAATTLQEPNAPDADTPPVILGGTPLAGLTYEGAVYYQSPLGTDEAAEFNEDDLELVGSTSESNTLPPGGGESLEIYRLKGGEKNHVYTLALPGQSFQPEDGTTITWEAEWVRWVAPNKSAPVTSGFMVPRPNSVEKLVERADVIAVGFISLVLAEKWIGPYGEDGKPTLAGEEGGLPYTDYDVRIESVLKGDGTVTDGGTVVLRMFGHLSNAGAIITPNVFSLPNPGDRLLFALGRNPDDTYGTGPEGLLKVDGEQVTYADGVPFETEVSPDQFVQQIKDAAADRADLSRLAAPALANEEQS